MKPARHGPDSGKKAISNPLAKKMIFVHPLTLAKYNAIKSPTICKSLKQKQIQCTV
jgi:hypothetical protein